ncbi:MAG: hypothetical protein GF398_03185 [Chitinivibrionales bacterium]|nr:hypothetical protein [Chitinivibrionales bacterium]
MYRLAIVVFAFLLVIQTQAKYEDQYGTDFGNRIKRVTRGQDFKVIWGRNGSSAYVFRGIMVYDSKQGDLVEVIEDVRQWRENQALMQKFPDIRPGPNRADGRYVYVAPLGNKIIFNITGFPDPYGASHGGGMEAWVADFGDIGLTTARPVPAEATGMNCYVLCIGLDVNTGKQWAYYTDTYDTGNMIRRFNIDNLSEDELVVERQKGRYGFRNFAGISADLNELVASHGDGALYYDLASGNDAINLKSQPDGEPVGTCNITISPDDEKNAFWIGKYGYNTGGTEGGPHSAIATNTDLLNVNTRVDHLIPNDPVFLEKMIANPSASTNTAICTQWAFDRKKCRVGTYVAWYKCAGRKNNPCSGKDPRATVVRFNDDLTEIEDFEQFIPASMDNKTITHGRPHMWIYPDVVNVGRELVGRARIGFEIAVSKGTIAFTAGAPGLVEIDLVAANGALAASRRSANSDRIVINRSRLRAGMYFMSIKINGVQVGRKLIML